MKTSKRGTVSQVATEAINRMNIAIEASSDNRSRMLDELKFSHGDQWRDEDRMQRQLDRRPCVTVNKTDTFIRAVVNNTREQRPRVRIHPVSGGADIQRAQVRQGLMRHIEVNSNADVAYDTAADYQARIGLGYFRITADYITERSFDQELFIKEIKNPFSVYFDPSSTQPDGLDAQWCVIVDRIKRSDFKLQYPKAIEQDFDSSGEGDSRNSWSTKEEIMIAEYWRVEYTPDKLFKLADGTCIFKSEAPEGADIGDFVGNSIIVDVRESMKRVVKWSKVTKTQELEKRDWPGRYIPVIPVYGSEMLQNGKVMRFGMTRNLMDPQRMYNFWRSQETEFAALAPKAPWLIVEGQTENHEDEWASANIKNHATLTWKPVLDEAGNPTPPPQRISPQAIPVASVNAAMSASEDLKAVAGMFDPALGAPGQETSGTMVSQRQKQSDLSQFHLYDNLTRSIRACGIICNDLFKYYYNGTRVIRIIGDDGVPDTVTINEQKADEILNDITIGEYDVVMETGPGYSTKREESLEAMMTMLRFFPQLGELAGDLIVSQMDFPAAQALVDRLRMANPLAQIEKDIPENLDPEAKQIVGQLMGQLQQTKQALQALQQEKDAKVFGVQEREKAITDREVMTQMAETQRTQLKEGKSDGRNTQDNQTLIETTQMRTDASLRETLIAAQVNLHKDNGTSRDASMDNIILEP